MRIFNWTGNASGDNGNPANDRLLFFRTVRHRMEHFDEYLDDYLQTVAARRFIPEYLGPKPPGDRGPFYLLLLLRGDG